MNYHQRKRRNDLPARQRDTLTIPEPLAAGVDEYRTARGIEQGAITVRKRCQSCGQYRDAEQHYPYRAIDRRSLADTCFQCRDSEAA